MNYKEQQKRTRIGVYTAAVTVIFVAILVCINILFSLFPATIRKPDVSLASYYTLCDETVQDIQALREEVRIYHITTSTAANTVIEVLLDRYASLSSHIKVIRIDPDYQSEFTAEYTSSTLSENSLIVESGRRFRIVPYENIFLTETVPNYELGKYEQKTTFHGVNAISGAVRFVTAESVPTLYMTASHEEFDFSDSLSTKLWYAGYAVYNLDLNTKKAIPEDCSCLIINSPNADFTEEELQAVRAYLANGGKVVFVSAEYSIATPRLFALMAECGLNGQAGVLQDHDAEFYLSGYPTVLTPTLEQNKITASLGSGAYCTMYLAHGITSAQAEGWTYIPVMTTSPSASLANKEDAVRRTYQVCAMAEHTSGAQVLWITTPYLLLDEMDTMASGANHTFFLSAIQHLSHTQPSALAVGKDTQIPALQMESSASALWGLLLCVVIPLLIVAIGLYIWRRRKLR